MASHTYQQRVSVHSSTKEETAAFLQTYKRVITVLTLRSLQPPTLKEPFGFIFTEQTKKLK